MPRVVKIVVPDEVKESDVAQWVAEGLSKRLLRKLVVESLSEGIDVNLEKALEEFEKTRDEVWRKVEKEYREKGLI
ncbi:hypothetical protein APE_0472a [Aeropyrum pernix K1]|uniref:Uncharacterized protein n=1 Tax=Aeropyrum pernix (strain ATCC 700893 / DSM 11879 / JCM 9820 / NBRC 100138 / K1) TaxID=272557 RepID=Q05E66_AERPE|nr:hypothetical protein [Aeropyrum pernix]BAF34735.1 hypothetical protein APE_0472a [Aeropyrum pernix K1]